LHRANIAHKECEWKDGDRGGLAEWKQTERKKKTKCALTSTGLLMEGLEDYFRVPRGSCIDPGHQHTYPNCAGASHLGVAD